MQHGPLACARSSARNTPRTLVVPTAVKDALGVFIRRYESIGAGSKEELLQLIGGQWREMQRNQRQAAVQETARGPKAATDGRALNAKIHSSEAVSRSARASRTAEFQNRN